MPDSTYENQKDSIHDMTEPIIDVAAFINDRSGSQKTGATGTGNEASAQQSFLQFLDTALGRGETNGLPWSRNTAEEMESKAGWLESFKHALFGSGVALKNMSLSGNALDSLKELLLADGFSEEDVDGVINGFLGNKARKDIGILELLHTIGELKNKSKAQAPDVVLEPSALPHLDVLLRSFGLEVRQIERLISQARMDGGNLSLRAFARNLKTVVTENKESVEKQTARVSAEVANQALDRMGMTKEAGMLNGPVSLERFVRLIEDKIAGLMPYHLSGTEEKARIGELLKSISVATQAQEDKNLGSKRRAAALREALLQDEKAKSKSKQASTGINEKWGQSQGKAFGAGVNSKDAMDAKEMDIEKWTQQEMGENEMASKVKKFVEPAAHRPSQSASDANRATAPTGSHEQVVSRMSTTQYVSKSDVGSIPAHVVHQVGRRLGLAVRRGENHVRLQLKPPHLGAIQLDLAMKDSGLKIMMVAENQYVKDLMVSHVNELREALANQGVELQRIDVEISRNFGQSMADAGGQSHKPGPWVRTTASASDKPEDDMTGIHIMSHTLHGDGRLDMFA